MAALRTLVVFAILGCIGSFAEGCPNTNVTRMCTFCEEDDLPFRYRLGCNIIRTPGYTMAGITESLRRETAAENFTQLLFAGYPDSVLSPATLAGFTAIEHLEILFSGLEYIEADTFSSLPQLKHLRVYENAKLKWLSGDSFRGISSLEILDLHRNSVEHLREDMQPFFSAVSREINLNGLPLHCDCHLLWLVDFIAANQDITISTNDVPCLSEPSANLSSLCLDVCELGYHPCHPNATCTAVNTTQPVCTCNTCQEGSGTECHEQLCPTQDMVCQPSSGECKCVTGSSMSSDGHHCTREVSEAFINLTRDCSRLQPTDTQKLSECAKELSDSATHHLTLPAEIPLVVSLLEDLVATLAEEEAQPPSFNISKNLVETASELLNEGNLQLWQDTTTDTTREVVAIFSAMNDLGALLLTHTNISNITTDNIAMVLVRPECESKGSLPNFDGHNISSDLLGEAPPTSSASTLSLPSSLFSDVFSETGVADCSQVGVVSLVYGGIGPPLSLNEDQLLASIGCSNVSEGSEDICSWYGDAPVICPTEWQLNSVVISATVVNSSKAISTQLSSPVTISLSHHDPDLSNPVCAFVDESQPLKSSDSWLTENCERNEGASSDTVTVCDCYHLTSFALVMSPTSSQPEDRSLSIATKAGLSLSISCLFITVVLLFGLRLKNKMLHQVHRQLALALGLAQLVFLVGVDRSAVPSPDQLCTAWAALLHYLLLATFLWQLCEGIHLLLLIGKVFGKFEKLLPLYGFISWGLPLLVVGPTLGLRFCDYGSASYCWITPDGGALWAFHGPVIAVLLINVVILVYVVGVIVKLSQRKEENACLLITLIHASVVLVPILGVTWALGFLVVGGGIYATVVEWLFFAFTTLQGVAIFFAHCVLNREVRSAFLRTMGCRRMAENQGTVVNLGRRMSRAGGSQSFMIPRHPSLTSGSLAVGGFVAPNAPPSRRESEIENPYHLNTIREESSYHDNTDEDHTSSPLNEDKHCYDDTTALT